MNSISKKVILSPVLEPLLVGLMCLIAAAVLGMAFVIPEGCIVTVVGAIIAPPLVHDSAEWLREAQEEARRWQPARTTQWRVVRRSTAL